MEGVQHAIKTAYALKDEQQRIAADVLGGRDGFVCLPTGYGKSLCYAILPWAFDELSRMRKDDKHSIVLVVSPLVSFSRVYVSIRLRIKKLEIAATFMPKCTILVEVDTEQKADDVPPLSPCHTACNPWLPNELRQIGQKCVQEFTRLYIANAYQAGDETMFYRQGEGAPPLYAVVTKPDPVERPYHPTLLLKGTARPLSRNECPPERRYASEMAAVAWVAFGGFERIYFRELLPPPMPTTTTHVTRPLLEDVKGFVNHVRNIEHTDKEKGRLRDAQTDEERAAMAATLVVAHMYHQLGVLAPHPDEVEVGGLEGLLPLGRQLEVKVPRVKAGPLRRDGGRLPMLARWVKPLPSNAVYQPYDHVARTIQTGDLLLFSSLKTTSSLIKLFDHAVFGHVGIACRLETTDEIYVWESKPYCIEAGVIIDGVQMAPLRYRITNGWCNTAAVRNITGLKTPQRQAMLDKMAAFMKETHGRPYDKNRLHLLLSALDLLDEPISLLKLNEEDLSSVFCSQLVAAAYQRMGLMEACKPANTYTPEDFTTSRHFQVTEGTMGPEVYIDLHAMLSAGDLEKQLSTS